jgi:type VI secretion system secreted protein VgrG
MPYTQDTRICTIETPLGANALIVQRFAASEGISRLFQFELDLVSTRGTIDPKKLVGQSVTVTIALESGGTRHFNGIVSRFGQGGIASHVSHADTERRLVAHRAVVVPKMWLLTRTADCRIFQDESGIDIIKKVLNEKGVTDLDVRAAGGKDKRVYCVQYRETAFNFVCRLMEEEGISYFFEHHDGKHVLVLADQSSHYEDCLGREAEYATTEGAGEQAGEIEDWYVERELQSGKYALNDYNFETPSTSLLAQTSTVAEIGGNTKYEIFDFPAEHQTMGDGEKRAKRRMEVEEAAAQRSHGSGTLPAFYAGARFKLKGHTYDGFNGEYVITSVQHSASQGVGHEGSGEGGTYSNSFSCLSSSVPLRPAFTTRKPVIQGLQTAVVTGPKGEEIHVDKYGRIKVQFHWDRQGKKDEKSSCWTRVAQTIAGKQWGATYWPRIGQEVIVEFVEGDPDRPLVTGCVYNAEQMPPYALPANKTQTGMKSHSSLGGGGFNEIRLEDKKDSEEIFIHAQKDENIQVLNDKSESVGHDETIQIGANRTETVGANETLGVAKNRSRSVGENEIVTVGLTRTHTVGVNEAITVGAAQEVTVGAARVLTVGANQTTTIGGNHSVSVGKEETHGVAKDAKWTVGKKLLIDAGDEITIQTGSAKIQMKKNGDILIEGKKITIKGSGDVVVKGQKILQN